MDCDRNKYYRKPSTSVNLRLLAITVVLWLLWEVSLLADDPELPPCLMQPAYLSIYLPDSGFFYLGGEDSIGDCDEVLSGEWIRGTSRIQDLFVHPSGPEGSGRFWTITLGIAEKEHSKPDRGVCISTNTVGWRTLQHYSQGALPWLKDLDDDGDAEFILWDSFPLHEEALASEYALVAWAYRLVSNDSLKIDWDLSRYLARSLANEYHSQLDSCPEYLREIRTKAAEALERFANNQCKILNPKVH
jgi:hypothetical protein